MCIISCPFFLMIRPLPSSTLFPYTTLFRSLSFMSCGQQDKINDQKIEAQIRSYIDNVYFKNNFTAEIIELKINDVQEVKLDSVVDRKSTRLNSSHVKISYAVFCLKKKKKKK